MLIIIDESGDPSFSEGCSKYFAIGALKFDSFETAEKLCFALREMKSRMNYKRELKFSKTHNKIKDEFFKILSGYNLTFVCCITRKEGFSDKVLRKNPKEFYINNLKTLFDKMHIIFNEEFNNDQKVTIKLDRLGDSVFRANCSSLLKKYSIKPHIKFVDSETDEIIQISDMLTGCVVRKITEGTNSEWFNRIKFKVIIVER